MSSAHTHMGLSNLSAEQLVNHMNLFNYYSSRYDICVNNCTAIVVALDNNSLCTSQILPLILAKVFLIH
jgi:hypothetical protein